MAGISLAAPFKQLSEEGIISLECFSCCISCGCAEISDAIEEDGRKFHGWCFYHAQDDEQRVDGKNFYLAFDSMDGEENTSRSVGHHIVKVLNDHKIKTEWSGNISERIMVIQ